MPFLARCRRIVVLVLAALLVFGCAGTPAPGGTGAPVDPINQEVIVWHAFSGAQEVALLELIDEFNRSNRWRITVAAERFRDLSDLRDQTLAAQSRRTLPDLVVADAAVAADLMASGASVALDEFISQAEFGLSQSALDDLLVPVRQSHFDNQVIAWPLGRELVVLGYNATWLGEIGLSEPPDHWSEFGEIACAASRDADGDGAFDHFGYWYVEDVATLQGWLYSRGTRLASPDGHRSAFADPAGRQAFTQLRDLFARACAQQADSPAGARAAFAGSRALFVFPRSSELPAYERAIAADQHVAMGISLLPVSGTLSATVPLVGPDLVLLNTTPSRRQAAWLVIRYLTEPEQAARWTQLTGQFPARRSALEDEALQAYLAAHPLLARAAEMLPAATREEPGPGWAGLHEVLAHALARVTAGAEPVDAVLDDAERAADALLASGP